LLFSSFRSFFQGAQEDESRDQVTVFVLAMLISEKKKDFDYLLSVPGVPLSPLASDGEHRWFLFSRIGVPSSEVQEIFSPSPIKYSSSLVTTV